ncbi:MAG: heavy metal translocating P-type ATPase [Silicimonas sp.]|nr:heavy metal translocating P-type ATPase [Silicimonas sp.]
MSVTACPGCTAGGEVADRLAGDQTLPTHELWLPKIHCINCIRGVEDALARLPDIDAARVNLSRKRVAIRATPGADPTPWIDALAQAGYEAHEARTNAEHAGDRGLLLRLGIAGFAMMNVMLLSVAVWSGATDATRDFFHWIAAAIALPAAVFCAEPFFSSALGAMRARRFNMDVPISLAIILACGLSLYETATGGAHAYFDAALSLTFFLLAGRVLEARMRRAARSAAADLAALEPRRVLVLEDGDKIGRKIEDVAIGDRLWLAAGARVPVDGVLKSLQVRVDRSALTGESDPIEIDEGETLTAGDVVMTGPVTMEARAVGEASTLRRMIQLAALAEGARTKYTSLADRAAELYVPLVHGLALAAFLGWSFATGDLMHALTIAIATLIITCPCALGLAVPAVATVATGRLFRAGVLVKSETALERLAEVDTVVFDKTGTLTRSVLKPPNDLTGEQLSVLKALALASDHPLSRGLVRALDDVRPAALDDVREIPGEGVLARMGDTVARLGSGAWLGQAGGTAFQIGEDVFGMEQSEQLVPGAADTVARLQTLGFPVHLLTGDTETHAARINAMLGADAVHAAMRPEDKQAMIARLQDEGHKVLMVGDGLNDTLALTQAWASIAPGSALEASQNAADVVLLGGTLERMADALGIARKARRRILENFGLAACYNAIAIPLALAGLATPLLAALAMSTSSISVTLNALRSGSIK